VVVARNPRGPRHQVFLVFEDGARFEFYGENFSCCSGMDKAPGIEHYVESAGGEIVQVYTAPGSDIPAHDVFAATTGEFPLYSVWSSPPEKPSRTRWLCSMGMAMAAIEKARRG
jgi:hypothetical protein